MKTKIELLERIEQLEKRLKELERAELAVDAAGFDIWENNFVTGETFGTNRRSFESLGYSGDELPANLIETFKKIHPDDLEAAMKDVNAHFAGETPRYQAEMRVLAKDGSWIWLGNYGRVVERDSEGQVTRFIGLTFNIDKRRIMEEEIKHLAYRDPLTGIHNRRGFNEIGEMELERAFRYHHDTSILIMDIDHLKEVNDSFGHLVGDEVLKGVTASIQGVVRQTDIKARWGGDEFIVMLLETNSSDAWEMAERLREHVNKHEFVSAGIISVSIGIAGMNPGDTLETLIKRADMALYLSKQNGRNRTELIR